jgi:YgiT-type zinc finger domain-containing protein
MTTENNRCPADTNCDGQVHRQQLDYTFKSNGKKITVPDLEILRCNKCHEIFFPAAANERIDLYQRFSGKFLVRIPPELHSQLTQVAKAHHRSLNQEITFLLSETLKEANESATLR